MGTRRWMPVALGLAFATPALLCAQTLDPNQVQNGASRQQVGGKMSVDLVMIKPDQLGVPLRHGGVIANSEVVTLDGRRLRQGQDYTVDNDAGMIYLYVTSKPGSSVSVSYRYDGSKPQSGSSSTGAAFTPFKLNFGQGASLGMMFGMGMAERTPDGNVLTSNIFGWNNAFNLGGSTNLSGIMLFGQRSQQQAQSSFEYQGNSVAPDQGKSRLVLQSLGGSLGGGTFKVDYQNVSKNFSGFSALTSGGYDAATAAQIAKEKGLQRLGFNMDKVQLGGLGFNESYKTVGDEKGGITWQNLGLSSGDLTLNYKQQKVDSHFARFADLAETDRDQLAKEAGITRTAWDAAYKTSFGALSFMNSSIDEVSNHHGIDRQDLKFAGKLFNFDMGSQKVETGFDRFASLNDPEQPQWSRELGLKRNWLSFDSSVLAGTPLKFSQYQIDSKTGGMQSMDASLMGKKWSFEHIARDVDKGFTALPNLTPQEITNNINAISNMYVKGGVPFDPSSQQPYFASPGVSRDFNRLTFNPSSTWSLSLESLALQGKQDGGSLNTMSFAGAGVNLSYRAQNLGKNFGELTSLMPFEQQKLGMIVGLNRTDLSFDAKMRGKSALSFSQSKGDVPTANGGFDRQSLAYNDPRLQFNMNSRNVGAGFTNVGQMLDPEAALLATMVGSHETDMQMKWQMLNNLKIEASSWNGFNPGLNQKRDVDNYLVDWSPSKGTSLQFQRYSGDPNNPLGFLLQNVLQRMSFSQDFGKAGILRYNSLATNYDGVQATLPDSKQSNLSYEAKINPTTSLKTDQTSTTFANGDTQHISANTISTEITKRAGVSLTDIAISGTGTQKGEHKHNVGFWMNLWGNVKLNFGVADDMNQLGTSTTQHTLSLSPGTVGNMQVGSATYNANTWQQGDRTQAASVISLSNVKPFNVGFLREMKFNIGQDTAADNGAWQKENKTLGLACKVGRNAIGFNYFGQMNALQQRAVDRTFTFATDQSDKARLKMNLLYKFRTLPNDRNIAIRNFSITARPWKGMELTNEVVTNPENPDPNQLLGSLPQPIRANKWKLDYLNNPNFKIQGSWEEQRNDSNNALARIGGMTFTMFEKSGSPVSVFLGVEQQGGNVPNHVTNRWSLRWDQRPGPNQALSLFIGNITYGGTLAPGQNSRNLSIDFQYQFRF